MAGGLKKDVELIFRGEDRVSPTIQGVKRSTADLTREINAQIEAAERGEGSVDDLARALKQLSEAQGDVGEITKLALAYEKLSEKHALAATKATELKSKEEALTAQVAAASNPTQRLINQRDAAGRAASKAAADEAKLATQLQEQETALRNAGVAGRTLEEINNEIRASALGAATAIHEAAGAMAAFKAAQDNAAAGKSRAGADQTFGALASSSGLPQAQIQFISTLENRVEALSAAMKEAAASKARLDAEMGSQAEKVAADRVRAMSEALNAADRATAAQGFRSMAASIEAAANDVGRFGSEAESAGTSMQRLSGVVQALVDPSRAAAATMDGIVEKINVAEAALNKTSGARRLSEYTKATNDLQLAQGGLLAKARDLDGFRDQDALVTRLTAQYREAQAETIQLAQAMRMSAEPTEEMANGLKKAQGNMDRLGTEMQRESTKLDVMRQKLSAAGIDVNNLAAAEQNLINESTRAAAAMQKLNSKTTGKGSFLGLNPYEMQNIGYQINDIVVSLASGQKPMTVFMQQGAQIGQVIPGAFAKIVRYAPELIGIVGILVALGGAMENAERKAHNLKLGDALGQGAGKDIGLTAHQVDILAQQLEKAGMKAADAGLEIRKMVGEGGTAAQMQQLVTGAKDLAVVMGEKVPQSLERFRSVMTGGMDAVEKMNQATGLLDSATMAHIRTLFESGRADEARAEAIRATQQAAENQRRHMEGPWAAAGRSAKRLWDDFKNSIAESGPFKAAQDFIGRMAKGVIFWLEAIRTHSFQTAQDIAYGGKEPGALPNQSQPVDMHDPEGDKLVKQGRLNLQLARAKEAGNKKLVKSLRSQISALQNDGHNNANIAALADIDYQSDADDIDKKNAQKAEQARKRAEAEAKRRAAAAKALAEQIKSQEEGILSAVESMDHKVAEKTSDDFKEREYGIRQEYAHLFRQLDEYDKLTKGRGRINGQSIEEVRAHIQANEEALIAVEHQKFNEEGINKILTERQTKLAAISDLVTQGVLTPTEGLAEEFATIDAYSQKIAEATQAALEAAQAFVSTYGNSPQMSAYIARLELMLQQNTGGTNLVAKKKAADRSIGEQESRINTILSERNELVAREDRRTALHLQTRKEGEERIAEIYRRVSPMVKDMTEELMKQAKIYANDGTDAGMLRYEQITALVEKLNGETERINPRLEEMQKNMMQVISTGIIGFIDELAQAFANLATGNGGVLDFLEAVGRAFLMMIANILKGIAQIIIEAIIVDMVERVTGVPIKEMLKAFGALHHEGGVVGTSGRSRAIPMMAFAGAPRYHTGGIAGLAPDETTAILKRGEEVLKETDPRHRWNGGLRGGGSGAGPKSLKQVLVVGDDQIAAAMSGPHGEEVFITHLVRNKETVKQVLGS